jgi:hypothetical protein
MFYYVKAGKGLIDKLARSERKHCDNAGTNANSENQVLQGSVSTGAKEHESIAGRVWAAGFCHVTACSSLAHVLKIVNHLIIQFQIF